MPVRCRECPFNPNVVKIEEVNQEQRDQIVANMLQGLDFICHKTRGSKELFACRGSLEYFDSKHPGLRYAQLEQEFSLTL